MRLIKTTIITIAALAVLVVIAELATTTTPTTREFYCYDGDDELDQKISEARRKIREKRYVEVVA